MWTEDKSTGFGIKRSALGSYIRLGFLWIIIPDSFLSLDYDENFNIMLHKYFKINLQWYAKIFCIWNPDEKPNILSEMPQLIEITKSYNFLSCFIIAISLD